MKGVACTFNLKWEEKINKRQQTKCNNNNNNNQHQTNKQAHLRCTMYVRTVHIPGYVWL